METQQLAPSEVPYTLIQLQSTDVDDQSGKLSHWDQIYEQLTPGAFAGCVTEAWFGCLQLLRETTSQSVHQAGRAWEGSSTFGVPLSMEGNAYFGGHKLRPGDAIVLGGGNELDFRTPRQLDIIAVSLDTVVLSDYADKVEHYVIDQTGVTDTKVLVSDPAQVEGFGQFLRTTLDSVFATPDLLRYPQLQKALEEAILGSVLALIGKVGSTQKAMISCVSRSEVVKRAKEYVRSHVDESLTIGDLCREIKVSRRTLQYSFQDVLDINPVAYIRATRLNGVRRALKSANPQKDTVQDIAARWGFWHLSHFCTDYKSMFGELPSATLRH
jgi:AraC family transcriptional regulator, ethanolamine operon transcriptional activator